MRQRVIPILAPTYAGTRHSRTRGERYETLAVRKVKPTMLIGASSSSGIISVLSTPAVRLEAAPVDRSAWTSARALIATGSSCAPLTNRGSIVSLVSRTSDGMSEAREIQAS